MTSLSRRTLLSGLGAGALTLAAGRPNLAGADPLPLIGGYKVRDLTGPAQTGAYAAPWTDLGIPARCPDGSLLYVGGDTFNGGGVGGPDWRCPVGLRSTRSDGVINGSVGGSHANGLVPEGHIAIGNGHTTAIPSDVFTIGGTMYLHLMRGVIYQTDHSDFWKSDDNGQTWTYLCQWPGNQYGGAFQQKTYAVANDGYCYVLSTVFNRSVNSALLLHKVRQDSVGDPSAYVPWGYANGAWGWGNAPTSIFGNRTWGEICYRAISGRYILSWFDPASYSIKALTFALPTSNLFNAPIQTTVIGCGAGQETGNLVRNLYGGFVVPGSTLDNLDLAVSQWYDNQNYRVMQYHITGVS